MAGSEATFPLSSTQTVRRGNRRRRGVLAAMSTLALAAVVASLAIGGVAVAPADILPALLDALAGEASRDGLILAHIRLPRTLAAFAVGAVLALAGAMAQGLFRNPLADPGLIGVSAGAALAAVTTIVFAGSVAAMLPAALAGAATPLGAFAGGFATTMLIYRIACRHGRAQVATMLLAGIAVNAICMALVGVLVYLSDDQQMRDLMFWQMGSLGAITWSTLLPCLPLLVLPLLFAPQVARPLNLLSLGEDEAELLGVEVDALVRRVVVLVALGVGAAVAIAGIIGFVGLVVPHLVRLAVGPDHRQLLVLSALGGGSLLLLADLVARTLVVPAELPIGLVTSAVGGPFFLWLLVRRGARLLH